ncbi:DUF1800 family protein [Hoeflea sp.]|uniref:DUF1800 family protein n=1 Tax=Hoeflea sp. TaxID=1940281 RepID=UPI0019B0995D|nr:DUF1800 family protein [Hoeflea sp.]MBC7284490.1 DUF1800 family protein [Hoeflea sp.]
MTPQEIWQYRFCLGRALPTGDLRENLVAQLADPVPVDTLFPRLKPWQDILAFRQTEFATPEERDAAKAEVMPKSQDYYGPLMNYCQSGDRPFLARLMLDIPNAAPTGGDIGKWGVYTYSFWKVLMRHMLSSHGDWLVGAILEHPQYRGFLNTEENIGPNSAQGNGSPPDENLARELHELLSVGDGVLSQETGDMREAALLLTGLRNFGFDPAYQEPGDRTVLGKRIAFRPDQTMIEEYLRWLAVHPAAAKTQVRRLVEPLLGTNFSRDAAFRERLEQVWLDTGGDRRAVLTAMVMDDAAWKPMRGAPVNSFVGYATHCNEHGLTHPAPERYQFGIRETLGYNFEHAPDPDGLPRDNRVIGGSFIVLRTVWRGTEAQRAKSMTHERIVV